jgi:hypothetical protein
VAGSALTGLLNAAVRDQADQVALAGAFALTMNGIALRPPHSEIVPIAAEILKEFEVIARTPPPPCGVADSFRRMLGSVPRIKWKSVFGANYRHVEKHIIYTRALADTNVSAWVNAMDVFNDWLLLALYGHDASIGAYNLGQIGSVMKSPRLKRSYPAIQSLVVDVHTKRLESLLSHPKTRGTGKPTKPIRWGYLKVAKRLLRKALRELEAKW